MSIAIHFCSNCGVPINDEDGEQEICLNCNANTKGEATRLIGEFRDEDIDRAKKAFFFIFLYRGITMNKVDRFSGDYDFLSNFYKIIILYEGEEYPTLEHAYQAAKCDHIEDRKYIRKTSSPAQAKLMGRIIQKRRDWDDIKIGVMYTLLKIKFSDPHLQKMLLNTGNWYLEEGNTWNDIFWGVYKGQGQNWLGRLLMRVREELRSCS